MPKYRFPNKVPFYKFLFNASSIAKNPIPFHNEIFEKYGESVAVKSPFYGHIVLSRDAKVAKHILQKKHKVYHKSKIQTKYLSKYVGYGLLTSSGDYWLQQRRLIQPAFHREKIEGLVHIIAASIDKQITQIKTNQLSDLYPIMNVLAFEVVAKSLFNFSADMDTLKRLQFIIERLQLFIVKELRKPFSKFKYWIKGEIQYHMKLVKESRAIILNIIEQRRNSTEQHDDLLDMLLHAQYEDGTYMSNDQLIDEILILFVAGHETTANALTFSLKLIAEDSQVLAKVQEEIERVNAPSIAPLTQLKELRYIKSCVEESMRLYPPAWITDRVNIEDDKLGKYYLKKGTIVGASIFEIHRNKNYWKDPENFDPERFNEEHRKDTLPYYMPFGAGPRLCIGNNFAMYEMMLTIKAILEKFTVSSDGKAIKMNPLITLKPIDIKLKFESKN